MRRRHGQQSIARRRFAIAGRGPVACKTMESSTECGELINEEVFEPASVQRSPSPSVEYDFIERPSQDFFCPVSLELLLEPQLTSCCGHHLSLEVAERLQRDEKACPMCNTDTWSAVLDKYHRRKAHEVRVRCWHNERGCEWEGEINGLQRHADSCEKRPWECVYCALKCTYGEGEGNHWPECLKFPEPCPNGCEVGSVERCGMEQHCSVCSLEPVACEMKEFGCSVVVPRKELATHMRESELQHLTAMTALNLRLTRQLQQDSAERDQKIKSMQQEMEHQKNEIKKLQGIDDKISGLTEKIAKMECEVVAKVDGQQKVLEAVSASVSEQKGHITELRRQTSYLLQGFGQGAIAGNMLCSGTKIFTFGKYNQYRDSDKDQLSVPFYTDQQGYKLRLKITYYSSPHNDIGASLCLIKGEYDDNLHWPVSIKVRLEVLNQIEDSRHVVKVITCTWSKMERGEDKAIHDYLMKYATLERQLGSVQFMMNDCLKFKVIVKVL